MAALPLRFGLVGAGNRARMAQAPALASAPDIDFVAVYGREPDETREIAAMYKVAVCNNFADLLNVVDGLAFAVPPDVQGQLAAVAAAAGKHLLLEKPLSASAATAEALAQEVANAGVASVVFFTARFQPDTRAWLAEMSSDPSLIGGAAIWLGTALLPSSPYNTQWRREMGGLWDLAPHAISVLWACLGPVCSVTADAGRGDLTHLVLHHENGASSVVTTTLAASKTSARYGLCVWGEHGWSYAPPQAAEPIAPLHVAMEELIANARAKRMDHPCDARFGRDVTLVLAEAERQIADRLQPPRLNGCTKTTADKPQAADGTLSP